MNRILPGLLIISMVCYSGICFGSAGETGERQPEERQSHIDQTKRYEKKAGPFEIGKNHVVVILDITEQEGFPPLYNSFEIKEETGISYYKKELEPAAESYVDIEGIFKLKGKSGEGLIIYFDTEPNAPQAGKSFQIFGIKQGKVKPLSPPISVYGELQPLPDAKSQDTKRLLDGDLIKVVQKTDFINVVVPLVVDLQKLTIAPIRAIGMFDINISETPNAPGTENQIDIKFYKEHNINSKVEIINYKSVGKVKFINAYANVQLINLGVALDIDISNLWLKVIINGRAGWVHDNDSFVTLGLRVAS